MYIYISIYIHIYQTWSSRRCLERVSRAATFVPIRLATYFEKRLKIGGYHLRSDTWQSPESIP